MLHSKRRVLAFIAFAGSLAAILAVGFISNLELSALADSSARVQRSYDLLQTLDDLTDALTDTETNQRGFLLTQDPSYLTQYDDAIAQIRLALIELRRLSIDESETRAAIDHLETLASGKLADLQKSILAAQAGSRHTAMANIAAGTGKRLMEAFLTGLRILVVDDEADARTLTRRVLEERGAQVITVGSTAEAMATVDDSSLISVIVSDIGMPEQDGYDLIKQMRALPGDAGRVPAVALTALARAEDRKNALLAGYQKHISKPVDPAELVAAIASVAGRAQAAGSG